MKFRNKNYDLLLVFVGSIIIALFLMLFNKSKEFGVNLITEITGVAITIFVINKILERRERQKRISIDKRILREVQAIIASYFSIWKHLAWRYLPNEKIVTEKDMLRVYPQLVTLCSIGDRFEIVSIHHPESWKLFFHNRSIKDCLENYYTTLTGETQTFINDFKMYLEPELLDKLLNIMECQYFKNIFLMNQEGTEKLLIEMDFDTNKLESYLNLDEQEHLIQFIELMNYSKRLRDVINKFTDVGVDLYQLNKYFALPSRFA